MPGFTSLLRQKVTQKIMASPATMQDAFTLYFSKRMLLLLAFGFASGFPYMLTGLTMTARLDDAGLSKSAIGLFALVSMPYSWKILWAPVLQTASPPVLKFWGQRRGWAAILLGVLVLATMSLAFTPVSNLTMLAIIAIILAFGSASFDVVLDAYRVEYLSSEDQAAGAVMFVNGYRVGMLAAGAGAVTLSDMLPWQPVLLIAALVQCTGFITIYLAPAITAAVATATPLLHRKYGIFDPLITPLIDFLKQPGALILLLIVVTYKLGDGFLSVMNYPFLVGDDGANISKATYSILVQTVGLFVAIAGGLLGGILATRLSLTAFLILGSVLQMLSNLGYVALTYSTDFWLLATVISIEEFTGGLGTAALFALLAALCDRRHTATHFALFTSLIALVRQLVAASSGFTADATGWPVFFLLSALLAVPALLLIMAQRNTLNELAAKHESQSAPTPET